MTYTLNLLDLLFTIHALSHGAVELNPLMRCVPIMIAYKVIIVGALLWWLEKRKERVAVIGKTFITAAYLAVVVWHITNIIFGGAFP